MSPYVRKTAAHAIAKLYACVPSHSLVVCLCMIGSSKCLGSLFRTRLAPGEKESLVEVLEQLLHDRVPVRFLRLLLSCSLFHDRHHLSLRI
jgi:hypothetical protein